jgi:hypothetical protein
MDANAGPSAKITTEIVTNIARGTGLAILAGLGVWARKLVGLPKRVTMLETINVAMLENLAALTKYTLAQNQHRRKEDRSPELIYAEDLLKKSDENLDRHLRSGLLRGKN